MKTYMVTISENAFPNPNSLYAVRLDKPSGARRFEVTQQRVNQLLAVADFEPVIDGGAIYLVGFRRREYPEVVTYPHGEGGDWGLPPNVSPQTLEADDAAFNDYLAESADREGLVSPTGYRCNGRY